MKKLFNKRFILIVGSTLTFLVILTIAVIFLTKEKVRFFSEGGYIIASGKEDSTKYYFDEGTNYKTNINKDLVFTDTSGEKVTVETNNFLHYADGGIKFLKNGVIMDLDSVNSSIVPYYNITNKSVLEYSQKSYYIEAIDKTLAFNNIIGRISQNKYIVAGVDINLHLAGNENVITGDYFEITFIEDGIIKVENQEVSYQTTAEDSYILSGDNIRIDLGLKRVYYDDEEKLSLEQLTIDGNENIEIIPLTPDGEEDSQGGSDGSGGTGQGGTGQGGNQGANDGTEGPGQGDGTPGDGQGGSGQGGNGGSGGGAGGSNQGGSSNRPLKTAVIEIVEANVGVNNLSAKFHISDPDKSIQGDLVLHITNSDTGKRVYTTIIDKSKNELNVGLSTLSPNSNYILSINEENNGEYDTQYFQKLFRTDELGISLDKKYVTSNSVAYEVKFEEDSEVRSAKVHIKDENYEDVLPSATVTKDNGFVLFEGLENNKTYNIVLDHVILDNLEYNDTYQMYASVITLKNTPYLSNLSSETKEQENTFIIGIDNIVDEDKSITKYTYYIYKASEVTSDNIDNLQPVQVIEKNDASRVTINIDNEKILPRTDYKFRVIAEYYDNEKYNEYETEVSGSFILAGKPYVEFILDKDNTTFNTMVGIVKLIDENCTVPIKGRSCSSVANYANNFKIEYQVVNSDEKKTINDVTFDPETLEYELRLDSDSSLLLANTEYLFSVYGDVDLRDGNKIINNYLIGTFREKTSSVDELYITWVQNESGVEDLINVSAKITSTDELIANSINNLTINLYAGNKKAELDAGGALTPIATETLSGKLKEEYYDKFFTINTLNTFKFVDKEVIVEEETIISRAIDMLKEKTNGRLEKYYTIEITDVFDTNYRNEIQIKKNQGTFVFETPATIRIEENELEPTIVATPIENQELDAVDGNGERIYEREKSSDLSDTTIVGYKVSVSVNPTTLENYFNDVKELIYYVCDADIDIDCTIDNAIAKQTIDLNEIEIGASDSETNILTYFYLENGTPYDTIDEGLTRGHNYVFKAKFNVVYDKITPEGIVSTEALYPIQTVESEIKETLKQTPTYSMYIYKSTENKVTYKYSFNDIDNALYDNKFYYTIDGGEVKTYDISEKDFVIEGLTNDSVYDISYKEALIKNENNITQIPVGTYIFDGKYTYSPEVVNFENITYENDNRLRVLILENEFNKSSVDRIAAYQVTLSADGVDDYIKIYPTNHLSTCQKDEVDYKCIIIDYAHIKKFKGKDTTVKLTAYYDSGIIDNDFLKISERENGYILQNNNVYNPDKIRGNYIYINDNKGIDTSPIPYGIYEYISNTSDKIQIIRKVNLDNYTFNNSILASATPSVTYANDSILIQDQSGNYQSINNKLIEKVDLGSESNYFRFNSYIPSIKVSSTTRLVNGVNLAITSYGIDEEILKNEFKNEDGKYYYYLRIYKDESKSEVYKEEKVEIIINEDNSNGNLSEITLTNYMPNTTYYFEVYAYMLKNNGYKETLLFDAGEGNNYKSSIYSFSTLKPEEIFRTTTYDVKSSTDGDVYAKREIQLVANTNQNVGTHDVRFDIIDKDGNIALSKTVTPQTIDKVNVSKIIEDITSNDFVFGAGYYTLKIYIETETFENPTQELLIHEEELKLRTLNKPQIEVDPIIEDINKLTFYVSITDSDKVIKDGKYCVSLLDSNHTLIPGVDEICGLAAKDPNQKIVFDNLTSDTVYVFYVYADIYRNNSNLSNCVGNGKEEDKDKCKTDKAENTIDLSTSTEHGVALGIPTITANSSSISFSFGNGVNIGNIKKIHYTLSSKSDGHIKSETYILDPNINLEQGEVRKTFERTLDGAREIYKLTINPEGLNLQSKISYLMSVTYSIEKNGGLVPLKSVTYTVGY